MGHVSKNAKREQGLLARLLLDQGKLTVRPKALALGPGQSFWCLLHPQAPHSHSLPSLWCTPQLFPDHIPTLLSLLFLDSPFSLFFNVFCPPSCCFQVVVTGSSQQLPALSSVSPPPVLTQLALQPPFLCCLAAWASLALPHLNSRTPSTHRQCRQTAPAEFCPGFAGSQGFGCCSTHERSSLILHSRLGCTIKAQVQKTNNGRTDLQPRPSASHQAP